MTNDNRRQKIEQEARQWLVRLGSGDVTGAEREAFEAWQDEDRAHGEALAYLAAIEAVAEESALELHGSRVPVLPVVSRRNVLAIAASLIVAVALGLLLPQWGARAPDIYVTEIGELREISLADGSRVYLSGDTRVAVVYSESQRRLNLTRGQALFTVEHDSSRPFFVDAQGTIIRALGTQFDVHKRPRGVTVSVLDGSVTVSQPVAIEGRSVEEAPLVVEKGQRVAYAQTDDAALVTAEISAAQPDRYATWRQGLLEFNLADLESVVADVNRHAKGRIVIADAALRDLPVTAVFRIGDFEEVAVALEQILPIKASIGSAGEIVLIRRN